MGFGNFTQTHAWKNFMAKLYGIGASVVIIGALFKIMHWPGASAMLIAGLGTEAVIFFFSAFEPVHEELDWSLVYPELAGLGDDDEIEIPERRKAGVPATSGEALAKFDDMLEKAGGGNFFDKIGKNFEALNDQVKELSNLSNVTVATNEFAENVKSASDSVSNLGDNYKESADNFKQSAESLNYSVENLQDAYSKAAQKVEETNTNFVEAYEKVAGSMDVDFSALKEGNQTYSENITSLNKNLGAINAIFELQLQEVDFDKMISELKGSVEHSRKYSQEITRLGQRLEALNTVYGNMLSAMNVKLED